jgi:FMN-dependent NADH-azoreductase
MATLLHLDSSPRPGSVTRALTATFAEAWQAAHPDGTVIRHDLPALALPHLGADELDAWFVDPSTWTDPQRAVMATSERLIADLLVADTIVLGVPMWNFGIPSSLKAWFDHVIRAGRTIGFTEAGPVGLLESPRTIVVTARGSEYGATTPLAALDFQEPYLRTLLGFIGVGELTFVHAERQGPNYADGPAVIDAARATLLSLAGSVTIDLTAGEVAQPV